MCAQSLRSCRRRRPRGETALAVKRSRESSALGEKKDLMKEKNRQAPRCIYPDSRILQLPVGDFKCPPPRHRAGSALSKRLEKFSPLPVLSLLPSFSAPPPSILHRTQKGHLVLSGEPLVESCLSSENNTPPPLTAAPPGSVSEVPATHSSTIFAKARRQSPGRTSPQLFVRLVIATRHPAS